MINWSRQKVMTRRFRTKIETDQLGTKVEIGQHRLIVAMNKLNQIELTEFNQTFITTNLLKFN